MEKKKALKEIFDLTKQAGFKEALYILSSIDGEITNKSIMSLIISCCSTCAANDSCTKNISEEDLYSFLKHIVSFIKSLDEAELLTYMQSIFHIMKFFTNKKSSNLIVKMESVLVPPFLSITLPKKHISTYESTASLLHNFVVKVKCNEFDFIEICNIITKMYVKVSNTSALLNTSYNCAVRMSQLHLPVKSIETYFFNLLNLIISNKMKVNSDENLKTFLSHFTLIYHGMFKQFDFKSAATLYKKTLELGIEIFKNDDCTDILTLMKFPLILSPLGSEDKLESLVKCKWSLSNLENSVLKHLAGTKIHSVIYTLIFAYYKSTNGSEWCKFSEERQLELLHFMWDLGRLELLPTYSCNCKCLIEKNVYQAFTYSQYICTLLEICVRQKSVSNEFNKESANLLSKYCEDVTVLKQYECEKWKTSWNALGMALYNIGVHLYQNSDRGCLHYFYTLIKYFIKFESQETKPILKFSIISSAFAVMCNYNVKDYKKCMMFSALAIKLCPNQRSSLIANWIKAKASQRDIGTPEAAQVQGITLVSVFKHFKHEVEFLTDGIDLLTQKDEIELLEFELEQYKMKWKSKVPMMSVIKELCEITELNKFVEIIINILGDCELMLHDDVPKILETTMNRYEEKIQSKTSPESTISLAFLYYMHYKYCVKDVIIKNTNEMERTKPVKQESDEPPDAIPRDPNEECDIVSSYDSLKLDRYFSVMKYLNKSLNLLHVVLKDSFEPSSSPKITMFMIYNLLLKISFEYRLHCHKVRCFQALQLAFTVAQLENHSWNIVWAVGFIIENSDVKSSYVKYLMLIADKILGSVECTSISNLKIILTYYICKCKALLYEDYKEAFRIFQMANELYDVQEDKSELQLIKSQLHLLHFKFVLLPCEYGVVDHKKSTLLTIHLANSTVYEVYNNSKLDGAYEMSLLLEANDELAKFHHLLRCPREVRAFCKETITLAQKLVLPIRCAYYLVYLAHADLRSSRLDDCHVKIEGLADILCLTKYNKRIEQDSKSLQCKEVEKDLEGITNGMQEMVLDLPVPNHYRKQLSPSSPTLVLQPFRIPAFLHHDEGCDCYCCVSLEYQSLVLEKTRLDAMFNVKQNNVKISNDFFQGAINFYELCFEKYESYKETVAKFISYDLIPDIRNELLRAYGFTLLDYSYHLMRNKNKTEALRITDRLIDLVRTKKLEHIYLYNDALFQKLGYVSTNYETSPVPRKVDNDLEMENLCPQQNIVSKTPESKQTKVTFTVQCTPSFSPPKRRVKKCLPFNLSPNHTSNNNKLQEKTSPVSRQSKTPAPKIKIYSSEDFTLKPKNPPATIHIFNDTGKRSRKKVMTNDENVCSTAAVSTPVLSLDSQNGLMRTRTKLLTEKLRQSTKKPDVIVTEENVTHTELANGRKKLPFRKNLFDQENGENGPNASQGASVRKSSRNRKI